MDHYDEQRERWEREIQYNRNHPTNTSTKGVPVMTQPMFLLTEDEYANLLASGMLWELYPEATGDAAIDLRENHYASPILNNWSIGGI